MKFLFVVVVAMQTLSTLNAVADSEQYVAFKAKAPCMEEVGRATSSIFRNQNWFKVPGLPVGEQMIQFFNRATTKMVLLSSTSAATKLEEFSQEGERISLTIWDTQKDCRGQSRDFPGDRLSEQADQQEQDDQ